MIFDNHFQYIDLIWIMFSSKSNSISVRFMSKFEYRDFDLIIL